MERAGEDSMDGPFVLELVENPHPVMLAAAVAARRRARWWRPFARHYWRGFLAAMATATGCAPADLLAWMERQS